MAATAYIAVVGCINSDIVAYVSRLPSAGETVFCSAVETHFGGKGANQAAQAALLLTNRHRTPQTGHECAFGTTGNVQVHQFEGAPVSREKGVFSKGAEAEDLHPPCGVAMIGRVGRDTAGASFLRHFCSLGIDATGVAIDPDNATGSAIVTVADGGENTIAYFPAANARISKECVAEDPVLSLLRNAKVVLSENGVPGAVSVECFRLAKEANAVTVFTPAPIDFVDPEICCFTDYLLCNAIEAQALLRMWGRQTDSTDMDSDTTIARHLHDGILETARKFTHGIRGLANVIITRGSRPCIVFANGNVSLVPLAQAIPEEAVVDTTGAGDSFAGSFAFFLLLTPNSPEVAVSRATFVAAQSVTRKGAAESYVGRCDLPEHLFMSQ